VYGLDLGQTVRVGHRRSVGDEGGAVRKRVAHVVEMRGRGGRRRRRGGRSRGGSAVVRVVLMLELELVLMLVMLLLVVMLLLLLLGVISMRTQKVLLAANVVVLFLEFLCLDDEIRVLLLQELDVVD